MSLAYNYSGSQRIILPIQLLQHTEMIVRKMYSVTRHLDKMAVHVLTAHAPARKIITSEATSAGRREVNKLNGNYEHNLNLLEELASFPFTEVLIHTYINTYTASSQIVSFYRIHCAYTLKLLLACRIRYSDCSRRKICD